MNLLSAIILSIVGMLIILFIVFDDSVIEKIKGGFMDIIAPTIIITEVIKVNDEVFYKGEIVEIKTLDLKTYKGKLDDFSRIRGICLDCSTNYESNRISIHLDRIISMEKINENNKKPKKKLF